MRLRAQKCGSVPVWGMQDGRLDGLTEVGRNGQTGSVDIKGQPYSLMN